MNSTQVKDWWPIILVVLGWIVSGAIGWTKMTGKVNGLGGRVKKVEETCASTGGRMERFEKEISEYRHDVQDTSRGLARVEKGVENVGENVSQGNLALGSLLHAMEKAIQEKDMRTQVRLTRIETIAKIEAKIGPIPTE